MNPKVYVANLHDQINKLMDENEELMIERNQLRAENAGLRTGYQAYERVNAELKAEVEKIDSDRKACWAEFKVQGRRLDELKAENDALRTALRPLLTHWDDVKPGESMNVDRARSAMRWGECP